MISSQNKGPARIRRAKAALVVIDIQERLLPAIFEKERVVQNTVRLLKGAALLGLPVLATEQYPKGLGPTVREIADACAALAPLEKVTFTACGAPGFLEMLKSKKISDVIVCGIETHVCVLQTSLDLLEAGYRVFVVADAISARTLENHQIGLNRTLAAGATAVSTEMVLFELLEKAGTAEFKQVLELVK